ncbi:hypothetical protein A2335_01330 [Candidatus Peregrinibacteria bacterium RIFOXYB2_FULL_32_7]|nr:MAG: hypothetical protein A2335_01330 [Candidatus Peregrinibacteria bacterium RIFOXYB2_FULL_32_7]
MHIAFDITALAEPKTGIGQYRFNLLKEFINHPPSFHRRRTGKLRIVNHEFTAYGFNFRSYKNLKAVEKLFKNTKNLNFSLYKIPRRPLIMSWILWRWPSLDFFVKNVDVFHVSDNMQSPTRKPTVATIHDLSAVMFPQYHSKKNAFVDKCRFQQISKYADQIICVSENTKNDFLNKYKFDPDRIHVIYNGVDHEKLFPIKDFEKIQKFKEKYHLFHPFILFLGTIEPRKNVFQLVKAFYELKKQEKIVQKLVICGKKGWFYDEIFKFIKEKKIEQDIIFLGYVDENDKNALINASDFIVYPSFYEGFGLPVVEAMSCGKSVITSKVSSLPEVAGDAALYLDPFSINDIADKIFTLTKDLDLRKKLEEKSLLQSKKFSWQKCAEETMKVYEKAALHLL